MITGELPNQHRSRRRNFVGQIELPDNSTLTSAPRAARSCRGASTSRGCGGGGCACGHVRKYWCLPTRLAGGLPYPYGNCIHLNPAELLLVLIYARSNLCGQVRMDEGARRERRVIAATIMLESNCMVETSFWLKALGAAESTSKIPRLLRK